MADVRVRAVKGYDSPTLGEAVEDLLTAFGIDQLVRPETAVVLKVNLLTDAAPEKAVTTHPAVVSAVIAALKRRGVQKMIIADSPSGDSSLKRLKALYQISGMADLVQEGVSLNENLSSSLCKLPQNGGMLEMLDVITKADVLINLAKLKTHAMAGLTLSAKNLFGAVPGFQKAKQHLLFAQPRLFGELLCRVALTVKPAISIVDGIVGMEGDGPMGGTPRALNLMAGAANPFLLDRALCQLLGVDPMLPISVAASIRLGLAPETMDTVTVTGDCPLIEQPLGDLRLPKTYRKPKTVWMAPPGISAILARLMPATKPRPEIQANCIGCGRCAEICPKQVITIRNWRAEMDAGNCIRCFCCHEVCPAQAVGIRTSRRKRRH